MRHLGGFPPLASFLYPGFLLLWTGAAGIHQQLSPDWRGSTPSSSFSCSSSPPTSLLKTTHTHTVLHTRLPSLDASPWFLLLCLFVFWLLLLVEIRTSISLLVLIPLGLWAALMLSFNQMQMSTQQANSNLDLWRECVIFRSAKYLSSFSFFRWKCEKCGVKITQHQTTDKWWKQETTNGLQQREWERRQEVKRLSDSNT